MINREKFTKAVSFSFRRDVLDDLVTLHNFRNQFLPNALREFFRHIHAPEERGEYLETLITKFSHRFCACNPDLMRELGLSPGKNIYSEFLLPLPLSGKNCSLCDIFLTIGKNYKYLFYCL